jgi:hypothetical protein
MNSAIAVIIIIGLILAILKYDNKRHVKNNITLWIPTVWMLLNTSRSLGVWFNNEATSIDDGSELDKIFVSLLIIIGIIILKARQYQFGENIKANKWYYLLLSYELLSAIWSDMPLIIVKRWIRFMLCPTIMILIVASEDNPKDAFKCIIRRIIYIHLPLSYLLISYFPIIGRHYNWAGKESWIGIATQKNAFAMLCVFSILYLVWSIKQEFINRNNKKYHFYIDIGMVALAIYLMLGAEHLFTTSATAFVALCLGAFLYVIFYKNSKSFYNFKPIFIIIIFCIMLYGTITPFIGKLKIFDVTAILNRSETLTDRSIIWEKLTPIVTDNLVLGHGFSYWTDGLTNYLLVNSGHNGYLDTMLTLGIVGLVLSFLFLFASFNKAMSEAKKDMNWSVLWISLILICIIRDISESSLDSFTGMYPIVIFMTLITK